jgi:hypothetical protein
VAPELVALLSEVQSDPDATGLILFGSAASESADGEPRWDCFESRLNERAAGEGG